MSLKLYWCYSSGANEAFRMAAFKVTPETSTTEKINNSVPPVIPVNEKTENNILRRVMPQRGNLQLELDGIRYSSCETGKVPPGYASVPVKLDDNGTIYDCEMVAGSVGVRLTSSGENLEGKEEKGIDTLQPVSGWWIYEKKKGE